MHYALFLDKKLVSCVLVFVDTDAQEAQFRKFATDHAYQRKGYGTLLLQAVMRELKSSGVTLLWCNARSTATGFYEKLGFVSNKGFEFVKAGLNYIKMQKELDRGKAG